MSFSLGLDLLEVRFVSTYAINIKYVHTNNLYGGTQVNFVRVFLQSVIDLQLLIYRFQNKSC